MFSTLCMRQTHFRLSALTQQGGPWTPKTSSYLAGLWTSTISCLLGSQLISFWEFSSTSTMSKKMCLMLLVFKMRLTARTCMVIILSIRTLRQNLVVKATYARTQKKSICWTRLSCTRVELGALSTSQFTLARLLRRSTRRTILALTMIRTIAFRTLTPASQDMHPCSELRPKLWLSHQTTHNISLKTSTQKASLSTECSLTSTH